jgi:prephenate dehydrogenase
VVRAAKKALADPGRFIPGHPMAGREKNGVDSARSDLFDGAAWILAPDSSVDLDVQIYQRIHTLIAAIGARVVVVDAAEHDKLMAILSHVPHVAASSLVMLAASHRGENGELLRFAGGGFKDTTRVAAGDPALWAGILQSNAELIADELKELTDILSGFERSIRSGDTEETRRMLAAAAEARKSIPAKWVPESAELIEVHVQMDNRPGAVAQITAEAGRRACNIQAIDIDHQTESYAILRLVLTDEGDIAGFVSALGEYGFEAEIYLPPTAPYAFPW